MPLFSFLVPTRGRPDQVRRLLQSIVDTTHRLEEIEVVLCVDEDDVESHHIRFEPVSVRTVFARPGVTMGELNRRCFEASTGRFVMLMNDDVVLRTRHWDREIYSAFASFGDDVGLVHVNDLLFRDKLCTFPILSRQACLEIGVCPSEYRRYRIDDHIYDTYNILAFIGHRRIVYLPDVIFEHLNHQTAPAGNDPNFISDEGKVYLPNPQILEFDARFFDANIETRKQNALSLAKLIGRLGQEQKQREAEIRLKGVKDQFGYRQPDFVQVQPSVASDATNNASVTIAIVTSDLYKPWAQKCLTLLKQHTSRFDLIILDNNGNKDFNHAREMNRAIRIARTDFLVLMDDDVLVEKGWLDGLLNSMDAETAVISPLHKDKDGNISHSGVYLLGDEWGAHAHLLDIPDEPRVTQCLCSACLLIDLRKTRGIFFDERYAKYFHDLDHSLQIWESGYKVVCTPHSVVTHLGGATMPHGSPGSTALWNRDIQIFAADWVRSGRLDKLQAGIFSRFPFLLLMNYVPRRIRSVFQTNSWEFSKFSTEAAEIESIAERLPLFQCLLVREVANCLADSMKRGDEMKIAFCQQVLERLKDVSVRAVGPVPMLMEAYRGYNLVAYLDRTLAVPQTLGPLDLTSKEAREHPEILSTASLDAAKSAIDGIMGGTRERSPVSDTGAPVLLQTYREHNLVRLNGSVYVVPLSLGPIDLTLESSRSRPEVLRAATIDDVKSALDKRPGSMPAASSWGRDQEQEPILIQEGYRGFNIVLFANAYYGVLQMDGAFDPARIRANRYTCVFKTDTLGNLKSLIDRTPLIARVAFRIKPILVNHPFLWRTAQKVNHVLTRGGAA